MSDFESAAFERARLIFRKMFSRLLQEAEMLLLHGAQPVEIDEALIEFGFTTGLFELQDQIGTDVEFEIRKQSRAGGKWPEGYESLISDRMVHEGRLGRQTAVGWYRYPGGKGKVEDPLIEDLVIEESRFAGVSRTGISKTDIVEILLCSLADEAFDLLNENEDLSREEINTVSINSLGFPGDEGGIIEYADHRGPADLIERYKAHQMRFTWLRPLSCRSSCLTLHQV